MRETVTTCALCGHQYPLESHQGCVSCPLQPNCNLICCPACGFSDVDSTRSKATKWISSIFHNKNAGKDADAKLDDPSILTIADLSPGMEARIVSLDAVHEGRREQLMAFGLAPGRCVQVLQHRPVTILRMDLTELALEDDVARRITVDQPRPMRTLVHRKRFRRKHRRRLRSRFLKGRGRRKKL